MRIGIDIGGTFTDFVVYDEANGDLRAFKVFSTPQEPAQAVLAGLTQLESRLPDAIIHGSTVATNAVLERKGARTALVTTRGFQDILTIGRQNRADIYDLFADRPEPLVPMALSFAISERVDSQGTVLASLREEEIPDLIAQLRAQSVEAVAVSLLFSFLYDEHERILEEALQQADFSVSRSSEILPEFREYERTSTTVINAYVSPIIDRYIGQLEEQLSGRELRIMQSNGGTMRASEARRHAVRSILSGPAGGAVGALHIARAAGYERAITFDMGGTSTDVSLLDGGLRITTEGEIGGLPLRVPVTDIHTVGAGGGSIAYKDVGGALRVGPLSAGSDPGPICYGQGGTEPTVSDANVVLGRLPADFFLGGRLELDVQAAEEALADLGDQLGIASLPGLSVAQTTALGVVEVVNTQMMRALRTISVERGYDPRDFALLSYGGAGGLHARDLASGLSVRRVLVPAIASTLSAFGMLVADVVKDYVQTVMLPDDTPYAALTGRLEVLADLARQEVAEEGVPSEHVNLYRQLDIRYRGQAYELAVPLTPDYVADFHRTHQRTYGHNDATMPLEIVNVRLRAVGTVASPALPEAEADATSLEEALFDERPLVLGRVGGQETHVANVPFYMGEKLSPGPVISGPAIVGLPDTTIFLAQGDRATLDVHRNLVVEVSQDG